MKKGFAVTAALCLVLVPFFAHGAEEAVIGFEAPLAASCGVKNPREECRVSGEGSYGASIYGGMPYGDLYLLGGISHFTFGVEVERQGGNWESPRRSTLRASFVEAGAAFPFGWTHIGTEKRKGYPLFVIVQGLLGSVDAHDGGNTRAAAGLKLGAMLTINRWHLLATARFIENWLGSSAPNRLAIGALGVGYEF